MREPAGTEQAPILVFGGTLEGRQVSDYLVSKRAPHVLCVATEYGEEVLTPKDCLTIHQGRMDEAQMRAFLREGKYRVTVDATHPYAAEVSKNIRAACEKEKVPYLRYLRPSTRQETAKAGADKADAEKSLQVCVDSAREAAEYLEQQSGTVFLTTGSKELHIFTETFSDKTRLFARVLPSAEVIASCRALGLEGKQICGMQGPFSAALNEAMLRQTKAAYLVTKDTGKTGGFPEKLEAAQKLGVCTVIIRRPEDAGYDWEDVKARLLPYIEESVPEAAKDELQAELPGNDTQQAETAKTDVQAGLPEIGTSARSISCIGIGMGTLATLTHEAAEAIREADIVFGAKRILESVMDMFGWQFGAEVPDGQFGEEIPDGRSGQEPATPEAAPLQNQKQPALVVEYIGTKIAEYLRQHPQYRRAAILMSGDVGFYSGARGIQRAFPEEEVRYYCGISSVVYFASKIPTSWQDAKLLSAHGKDINLLNYVRRYPKILMLVSGREDVERICGKLCAAEMEQVRVTVGTNLSYPEETVQSGRPCDFLRCTTTGLHILMLENAAAAHLVTPGIPDEAFVRGKVPMTKEEIRILSVAKMRLTEDAVVYDVGAGTGSVSIEIARLCTAGTVYAVERNPEGIALIRENSRKMGLSNVIPVEGLAPGALEALPAPTHAFIGGSSGNMREIIEVLRAKNPDVRITINTIALESIAEAMTIVKELEIEDADIVQVSAAKSRVLGRYHMMTGLNPVYIISFGGSGSFR